MMKWLRKHNRMLLAVFMAFLMVVFVGGSALQNMLTPDLSSMDIFESSLGSISQADLNQAKSSTSLMTAFGYPWQAPFGRLYGIEPLGLPDWILLTREAKKFGHSTNPDFFEENLRNQGALEPVRRQARAMRIQPRHIYHAAAEYGMVREFAWSIAVTNRPSEADIRVLAKAALDKVRVNVVILPSAAFMDREETFTDAVLQEQLDKYRDVERGPGMEFGYRVPPSVKVQYFRIDTAAIASQVRISESALKREARAYFDANQTSDGIFRAPREAPIDGPPSGAPPLDPYLTWADAEQITLDKIRKNYAQEAAQSIANHILGHTRDPWGNELRGEDGYRTRPAGVDDPQYCENIVANIPGKIAYPGTVSVTTTDFFTATKAMRVPEIGTADVPTGQRQSMNLKNLAFKCQGITDIPERAPAAEYLALYEPSPYILRSRAAGDLFIFRVVETKEAHPAESIDEVREELEADLRTLHGFERARQRADALMTAARTTGALKEAFEGDPDLTKLRQEKPAGRQITYVEPEPFARVDATQAAYATDGAPTLVRELQGQVPEHVIDNIFALEKATDPLAVIEWKERAQVLAIQWLETITGRQDQFEDAREDLIRQIEDNRLRTALSEWLDPQQIRARSSLVRVGR